MQNLSQPFPKPVHASDTKEQENKQTAIYSKQQFMAKSCLHFFGIIWTREGTRKMIRSNGSTVMELPDMMLGVPLVLVRSVKIRPGSNLEVPLECTRQLTDKMDIRIDTGFHHKNPNTYIPPCCINNPNNKHNPRYMPLTIFYLSTVDHLYIGKDTVITFAEQPVLET